MLKAVVFDFDGLILDTESLEFATFQSLFETYGHRLTLEEWSGCVGTDLSVYNPYDHLDRVAGTPLDREELRRKRHELMNGLLASETVRPGVEAYLREAQALGLRIGLASSSSREWVVGHLSRLGLLDRFETIHTRDDVAKVKPDPELYLKAAASLGVLPEEAVAFEDSPNGALAAYRAGLKCVIVPNSVTDTLPFGEHTLRIRSMADRSLTELIGQINAAETAEAADVS